jgi:hypothetical protein
MAAAKVSMEVAVQGPGVITTRCSMPREAAARPRATNASAASSFSRRVDRVFSIASYGRPASRQCRARTWSLWVTVRPPSGMSNRLQASP